MKRSGMRRIAWMLGAIVVSAVLHAGFAQADYPTRNIQLIVPFAAGGGTDAVARTFADIAEEQLGVAVTVINRTGGSGAVGMTEGANASATGYTVTMITREIVSLPQLGLSPVSWESFQPVALINEDPALILVRQDSPYESVADLLNDARERPGRITYASTAQPNLYVLAVEITQDVEFNHIPYDGAAPSLTALLGGHVDFTMMNPGEAISQIRAEQVRPLAVLAQERVEGLPDVPTMIELGYEVTSGTWRGLAVPPGTPEAVVQRLEEVAAAVVQDPRFVEVMDRMTLGIRYLNAEAFQAFMEVDAELVGLIVDALE